MVITFSGTDNVGIAGFEYHLDGTEPYNWIFTTSTSVTFDNIAAGIHLFEVRAIDTAGNKDANPYGAGFSWTVTESISNYHYGPSMVLSGSNYYDVDSSNALELTRFSVAAWFKTSEDYKSPAYLVNKGGMGSDILGMNLNYGIRMTGSETLQAGFETGDGVDNLVSSPLSYNDGQWHYTACTYDGTTLKLYVDGKLVASKALSSVPDSSGNEPLRVGSNSVTDTGYFVGNIDEVAVWKNALTAGDVFSTYDSGALPTSGLELYLPF
jgi:hypothetical protein